MKGLSLPCTCNDDTDRKDDGYFHNAPPYHLHLT